MMFQETQLHLFEPATYGLHDRRWTRNYWDLLRDGRRISWDPSAILGALSLNYPTGDRTLFKELVRQPWLSDILPDGTVELQKIPEHGLQWKRPEAIADDFISLLCAEAERVCKGHKEIYILTSGGLDSRIVAAVCARLWKENRIPARPVSVTWGLEDSRDVVYGRRTAEILGFEWIHIPIDEETICQNIEASVDHLLCFSPPSGIHGALWFKNASRDALVLAGSYGDSIGRGEFSGRNLIELLPISPRNPFSILSESAALEATDGIQRDLKTLYQRSPHSFEHARLEHQMQGYYMRGMIGHTMCILNNFCNIYQMFTAPEVYSYIWSLHPLCRNDVVYANMLQELNVKLAQLPWARTNRALRGATIGADKTLRKGFHKYIEWIGGPVFDRYRDYMQPDWFAATNLFDGAAVSELKNRMESDPESLRAYGIRPYEIWLWLISFKRLSERLEQRNIKCLYQPQMDVSGLGSVTVPVDLYGRTGRYLSQFSALKYLRKKIRYSIKRLQFLMKYPPWKRT